MRTIIYYQATFKKVTGLKAKKEDYFIDSFPALEGLKKGIVTDTLVLGYLKTTRNVKQGDVFYITELKRLDELGKSFYY